MADAKQKITDETEISTTELAAVLGITARRVQQLAQDGTLPTAKRGRFLLADSVQRFIRFSTAAPVDEEDQKLEKLRRRSDAQIKASKALVAKLEADELNGSMHRAEDVEAVITDLIYTVRGALMALPGRLAIDTAAAATAAETSAIIQREAYKILRELSAYQYDPKVFADRVRERQEWSSRDADE